MAKIPLLEMYFLRHVLAAVVHTAGPGSTIINASQNLQTTKTHTHTHTNTHTHTHIYIYK